MSVSNPIQGGYISLSAAGATGTKATAAPPAAGPLFGLANGLGGVRTRAGVVVNADTAMRVTTVLRCMSLISTLQASLPLVLRKRVKNGWTEAKKHPLFKLLKRRPNPWQTSFDFRRLLVVWLMQRGKAFAYVERNGRGQVTKLVPVHPLLVTELRAYDGTPVYDFCFWPGGERYRVTSENMIHLRWMTTDGYTSLSPIQYAAGTLGVTIAAEEYGARFFGGGAQPNGVLSVPGELSDEASTRIRLQWESTYNGLQNAHRTVVLGEGAKYERIGIPPGEAQFLELRGFQVEDVGRIYGVPPFILGHTAKSTSWGTGLEQQMRGFLSLVLKPLYLDGTEREFERALLLDTEDDDYELRHDTTQLEMGDMRAFAEWASKLVLAGVFNADEVRERVGYNPRPGGQEYRVPVNTAPSGTGTDSGGPSADDIADAVAQRLQE